MSERTEEVDGPTLTEPARMISQRQARHCVEAFVARMAPWPVGEVSHDGHPLWPSLPNHVSEMVVNGTRGHFHGPSDFPTIRLW